MSTTPFTPRYHSIVERVALLNPSTFERPVDFLILLKLAWYADFKTGAGAEPSHDTLAEELGIERETVLRGLARLERTAWIRGRRRHRQTTVYRVYVERLPTSHPNHVPLRDRAVTQDELLGDQAVTQDEPQRDQAVTQESDSLRDQQRDQVITRSPEIPVQVQEPRPTEPSETPTHEERLAAQGQLAGLLRSVLNPETKRRNDARRIAKVFRGLCGRYRWADAGEAKAGLRRELRRLKIPYTPADLDDAISWVDAADIAQHARTG